MRDRLDDKTARKQADFPKPGPKSLSARVDGLIAEISEVVNPDRAWEEPLRLILSHPRPPARLRDLRDALRIVARRSTYGERTVNALVHAAAMAGRQADMKDMLEPVQCALLALVAGLSCRPEVLMQTAWKLIQHGGIEMLVMPSSHQDSAHSFGGSPAKSFAAREAISLAVARTVAIVLQTYVSEGNPVRGWSASELQAGLDALWLAYAYCQIGIGSSRLQRSDLLEDFKQFGAPLWRTLAAYLDRAGLEATGSHTSSPVADLARLSLLLEGNKQRMASDESTSKGTPSANRHVVCKRAIPPSASREEKEEIKQHKVLEEALRVVAMPAVNALRQTEATLLSEFPWASTSLDVIFSDLMGRANLGVTSLVIPPTLLVGPPGSGKTRLARRLAESFAIPRIDVCLAGTSDTKILSGTSRGWAGSRPGELASLMARNECASAIVTLDEIDKARDHLRQGAGINAYLLGLFERETANHHYDCFLKTECDFSFVSWICTANALSTLSAPLRSRLRILSVPQPQSEHFPAIAVSVVREMEERWELAEGVLPAARDLDVDLSRLTSARQVRTAVEARVTAWSRSVVRH